MATLKDVSSQLQTLNETTLTIAKYSESINNLTDSMHQLTKKFLNNQMRDYYDNLESEREKKKTADALTKVENEKKDNDSKQDSGFGPAMTFLSGFFLKNWKNVALWALKATGVVYLIKKLAELFNIGPEKLPNERVPVKIPKPVTTALDEKPPKPIEEPKAQTEEKPKTPSKAKSTKSELQTKALKDYKAKIAARNIEAAIDGSKWKKIQTGILDTKDMMAYKNIRAGQIIDAKLAKVDAIVKKGTDVLKTPFKAVADSKLGQAVGNTKIAKVAGKTLETGAKTLKVAGKAAGPVGVALTAYDTIKTAEDLEAYMNDKGIKPEIIKQVLEKFKIGYGTQTFIGGTADLFKYLLYPWRKNGGTAQELYNQDYTGEIQQNVLKEYKDAIDKIMQNPNNMIDANKIQRRDIKTVDTIKELDKQTKEATENQQKKLMMMNVSAPTNNSVVNNNTNIGSQPIDVGSGTNRLDNSAGRPQL